MSAQNSPGPADDSARESVSRRRAALRPTPADSRGMDQAMRVLSYLISGVVVWGGLGWLGDFLLKTNFLLPIGIILGAGLGVYVIIVKYGRVAPPSDEKSPDTKSTDTGEPNGPKN
jgi:F0F1-type ATP synthase assembly protein I